MTNKIYILGLILSISFNVFGQNESEPNNSFGEANMLTLDDLSVTVQGAINPEGDADYYAVEVPRGGVFVANVTNVPSTIDMRLNLYDAAQLQVTDIGGDSDTAGSNGEPVNLTKLVCEAGTYYFRLKDGSDNDSDPGLYNFTIEFDTLDVYECNNDFPTATPIQIGDTIDAKIRSTGDVDFYSVEVPTAGVFVANVTNVPSDIDMRLSMYDAGQNEIDDLGGDSDVSGTNGEPVYLVKSVCEPGIYYFELRDGATQESSPDCYNFVVEFETCDIYECNNEFATAAPVQIGDTINAKIRSAGDIDFYSVEVPRAGVFVANVTNVPSNIDMRLRLYDPTQNVINLEGDSDPSGTNGESVNLNKLVCEPGIYYFELWDGATAESSPDFYDFMVAFDTLDVYECNNDFATATPIAVCDTTLATLNSVGDVDYYVFDAMESQLITVKLLNVPSNINSRIRIFNASQEQIYTEFQAPGESITYDFVPPSTGQFYIIVEDVADNGSSSQLYTLLLCAESCLTNIDIPFDNDISIYPNPTSDVIVIEFEDVSQYANTHLKIFNAIGEEVISYNNVEINGRIDMSNLPNGLFFFKLENGNQSTVKKVLKK